MRSLIIDDNQLEKVNGITSEYPYTMHRHTMGNYSVPWHWHEEFEILYVDSGAVRITTENREYVVHEGEFSFTNSNVLETIATEDGYDSAQTTAHIFNPTLLGGHFQSVYYNRYLKPISMNRQIEVLVITRKTDRGKKLCKMVNELTLLQQHEHVEFQTRNKLSEIWLLLMDEIFDYLHSRPTDSIPHQERIRVMLSYIRHHYSEKITLHELAQSASISEREVSRTFKKVLGKKPIDYLNEYRLNQACILLEDTDDPITDVAINAGFTDSAYFGKQFRKQFNCTPSEYRRDRRSTEEE